MAENNFFEEENRKAEEAAQKLAQDQDAAVKAENEKRVTEEEQKANDSSDSSRAASAEQFSNNLAAATAQKNEEELEKIREFGRELNTETEVEATYIENPAEMTKGVTEALNEMDAQPIPVAPTPTNIQQAGFGGTPPLPPTPADDQTFTGNMQDDGSIVTDDTFGNQYKVLNVTDDQTFTGNIQDDGSIVTDDTFGNQYKKANYWDSDEHKKEKKEVSDAFMGAKSLEDMIENGGWALMRYLLRNILTTVAQRDYNERYNKERKDFVKQGRQAYESDYFTKRGIEQAEYYDLLDAWAQNGAQSSKKVKGFAENNGFLRKDGSFDASKMTKNHKEKLGKIMADDPATREAVRNGIELLTGRVAGDGEIEELIKGIAGNDKHVAADFYDNYGGFHKFKAFEKQIKAEAAAEEEKQQPQAQGKIQTEQAEQKAPEKEVAQNAPQRSADPFGRPEAQTQSGPAPVNAPQPQMRPGYTPSANTTGLKYTNEPIQVPEYHGNFKQAKSPELGDLPARARASIAFSHDVAKDTQKNRANAMMVAQARNGQTITPNMGGNAFTIDMSRNG